MGQIEFAPANMGLKLTQPDAHVKAVPGRNPNMPPWFEDLGVDSFGQILGHADLKSLQAPEVAKSPLSSIAPTDKDKNVINQEEVGEISADQAQNIIKAEDGHSSDSDSSSSKEVLPEGSSSWETISLGNSTEVQNRTVAVKQPEPIKIDGIPYPREEASQMSDASLLGNNIPGGDPLAGGFTDGMTLMPPAEKMATEQYNPKVRNIPLWKPKAKGPEPPPLFILPQDNPERIVSTNIDMLRPIVATSTWTTKISGSVITSTTVSTVDQKALKFKSCIFGCPELTSSDSLVGTTTIVTVLPYQLPCSLVSCPPCPACFQSTVKVSVCPFIETVQAKARTTFVNGPTVTVIRSTVTRTRCTETKTISVKPTPCSCPTETATVTVTVEGRSSRSRSSLSDGKSQFVDPALIMDFPSEHSKPDDVVVQKNNVELASTVTETILSTVFATPSKRMPSLTITKTIFNERVMVTVTTTVLPVTTPTDENTGVCSTFIICNPTQFTCPAQVTNLPQIKAVVQSIMEGQEKYGSAGVVNRRLTPNGAFVDEGSAGLFGDGLEKVGGLAPINAFGFGPGGMFEKVLGAGLVPPKETTTELLQPPQPSSTSQSASAMKATVQSAPVSSTRVIEAQPTAEGGDQARRTVIKRSRKQSASSAASPLMHVSGLVTILSTILYLVI